MRKGGKTMGRKVLALFMTVSLIILTGCKSEMPKKTVRLLTWGYESSRYQGLEDAIRRYNAAASDEQYTLEIQNYTDSSWNWNEYMEIFEKYQPDMMIVNSDHLGEMVQKGYLEPIDEIVEQPIFQENYFSPLVPSIQCEGQSWGLLIDSDVNMVFWNRDVLAALGFSEEDLTAFPEWVRSGRITLQDLTALAKQAIQNNLCTYGVLHRPAPGNYFSAMAEVFGALQIKADGAVAFSEETMIEMLSFFKASADMCNEELPNNWSDYNEAFINGRAAVVFGACWTLYDAIVEKGADAKQLEEKYIPTLIPAVRQGESPFTVSNSMMITLRKESEHKEALKKILAKAYSDWEVHAVHAAETYHMPVASTAVNSLAFQENQFLVDNMYMLDYTFFVPNHQDVVMWYQALYQAVKSVENGSGSEKEVANTFAQDFCEKNADE